MRQTSARLRPPRNRFDDRSVGWRRAQLLIVVGAVVLPVIVLGVLIAPARGWLLGIGAVLAVFGVLLAMELPAWWHRVHRWEVTDQAVYALTGYFWRTWRIAPMSRIQTVDTTQGPLQRSFGLSTVVVTTASSAGAVRLDGLAQAVAEELAEELTQLAEAAPGDAT
ncbi:PH domain-containing protein [Tessaracoccus caeni]|uniref:PH domain-containing protein n=1 Tax=Tessaracoccus caeni TaxID=3031239 RepID=UPI0023DCD326|nr:PH domain-containing protein [Tessaracoccus caeni]MDF1488724.1 PH domain-containing protein [Tessaracoccus caeni]